jgi:hypothetical protein
MLNKFFFVFFISLLIIVCCIISGCQIKDAKYSTVVAYDWEITNDSDYLDLYKSVLENRTLYIKLKEDNTWENAIIKTAENVENAKPAYTAQTSVVDSGYNTYSINRSNITEYKNGIKTINANVYEHKKVDYSSSLKPSYDIGFIDITLFDDLLGNAMEIESLYKERPKGWKDTIEQKLRNRSANKQASSRDYTVIIIHTDIALNNAELKQFIYENVFLENENERFKAGSVVASGNNAMCFFPYKITKKDNLINLIVFNVLFEKETKFTWIFNEEALSKNQ